LYVTFILIYQACFAAQGEKGKSQPNRPLSLISPLKPHTQNYIPKPKHPKPHN
jgi:hypothetical protein